MVLEGGKLSAGGGSPNVVGRGSFLYLRCYMITKHSASVFKIESSISQKLPSHFLQEFQGVIKLVSDICHFTPLSHLNLNTFRLPEIVESMFR